jgi:small-conductance mechanosensitive channel
MNTILEYQLFKLGNFSLQVWDLVIVALIVLGSRLLFMIIGKGLNRNSRLDTGAKYSIRQLIRYTMIVVVLVVCITILGFDLSVLFVGSAALLVGIGFGLQNLFRDFISGIIILFDNTVKVHDVIEVDGIVCRVREIKLRTTTVITREDKCIILPNSVITSSNVVNWTYSQLTSRFEVVLNLAYHDDIPAIMKLLKETTLSHKAVSSSPEPSIRITRFAESTIEITVMFWCSEVFRVENIKSQIRVSIYKALRDNNIEFPYPRRIISLKQEEPK